MHKQVCGIGTDVVNYFVVVISEKENDLGRVANTNVAVVLVF